MRNKKHGFGHTAVNVMIIALIAAIYFCMQPQQATQAAFSPTAIYRGHSSSAVALQFVVSWDAPALRDILDTLESHSAHASFFVSGKWAENNPDMLKKILSLGHEIGTLGYASESDGDMDWLIEDISRSLDIIKEETGFTCSLYYCGNRDLTASARAASALGLKNVRCTQDLLCARGDSRDIIGRVPQKVRAGSILLMTPTGQAAKALPSVIEAAAAQGLYLTSTGRVLD